MKKKKQIEYMAKVMKYGHQCNYKLAELTNEGWSGNIAPTYAYVICGECGDVKKVTVKDETVKKV